MTRPSIHTICLAAAITLVTLAGCKKSDQPQKPPPSSPAPIAVPSKAPPPLPTPPSVSVSEIKLGKAAGQDKKVTSETDSFNSGDANIYASVETKGDGMATVKARWTYAVGDKSVLVTESSETAVIKGQAITGFEIIRPSGWKPGDYQLEVFLGDKSAGIKKFTVR